jgi:hypothetical protein
MVHDCFGNPIPDDPYDDYVPQFQASVRERALFHAWVFIGCLLTGALAAVGYTYLR